uniref:NADH-ubiquinone oxidoreductase chain 5 n=1 Tax=Metaphire californica TaxID=298374 RepID=A0A0G3DJA1_9ANNE|nr:NADH dehydrogenase subunit 5 [Metaphire californica]AKJ52261.1 NADH dehydrogenase subunit 5 [Metaphire californica]BDQ43532.1 NADH dehydrogenase subunit 5 [Metaphire californica]
MFMQFKIHKQASMLMWALFTLMAPLSIYMMLNNKTTLIEWTLFNISSTPVMMTIILDPVGTMFASTVLLISANVLQFSTVYMKDDKFIDRFTVLVLLFVLSMNMLIFFPHLMILLLGWDGLGLVSFILVIYYQNPKSLAAGMITALTNRIGDVMLLLSIAWTLNQGQWNILHMWETSLFSWQSGAILLAAMTKSAQMPFSSWLPAAMAAPTPVSALVHSSTLVTAGVFLLIRFYPFLSSTTWFNQLLLLIAVCTTTMAGLSAMTECDMKKIIALSTLSQLGMMMAAMGLGMVNLAYFHMVTHALFKALLFICAGTLIHSHMHSQDLRWMGNITTQMPTTTSCFMLANMALCGAPFMSGFYSKDMIVESSIFYSQNLTMLIIILFTVSLTSFYTMRFSLTTIWGPSNCSPFIQLEESGPLTTPMLVLSSMSIISGASLIWTMPMNQEPMTMTTTMKTMPMIMVVLGLLTAWNMNTQQVKQAPLMMSIPMTHYASCLMWFLVPLSSQFTMKMPMYVSHNYLKSLDQSWLELLGGQGMVSSSFLASNSMMKMFNTKPVNYLVMSSISMLVILTML